MDNYAKQIADLQATRKAKADEMKALAEKAAEQGRTMDTGEQENFDNLKAEIGSIDKGISNLRELEAIEKAEAADAATATAVSGDDKAKGSVTITRGAAEAKNTTKLEQGNGLGFARLARVKAVAFKDHADPVAVAQNLYPSDEGLVKALQVSKAAVPAANTGNALFAGNTVLDGGAYFADFVEYLRERSLLGQITDRLRTLPLNTNVLIQGTGGAAKWTKEGQSKPVTSWQYTNTKLDPYKVAAIAVATEEMLDRSSVAIDTLIRDELARAVNSRIDSTFASDASAVTGESPAGIFAGTGALSLSGGSDVASIRCDIATYLNAILADSKTLNGAFWIMPEAVAVNLSLIANEVGAAAFPGIGPNGGTFGGLPVFTSGYLPVESEGSVVALVKGDEIFLGDEGGIRVSASDQATIVMDDSPTGEVNTPTGITPGSQQVVNMWQADSVAFRVERFISWAKRRPGSVAWGHVGWDACAS